MQGTEQWVVRSPGAISGRQLRYLLTTLLIEAGRPLTVRELVLLCNREGVVFQGRASKVISDALRWEISWSRVTRIGRGVYRASSGMIPRSTRHWIAKRVRQVRVYLAAVRTQAGQAVYLVHPGWSTVQIT